MNATETTLHVFEKAGLGLAPYTFVGVQSDEDRAEIQSERRSSGLTYTENHCTSCDYCGQAIHNAYRLRSADGKVFKVGCDCIEKAGDRGLRQIVKDEEARKRRAKADKRRAAERARIKAAGHAFLEGRCEGLANLPHPSIPGATMLDYLAFCFGPGVGGTLKAAMIVERHLDAGT